MKIFKFIIIAFSLLFIFLYKVQAQWVTGTPPNLYTTTNQVGIGTATPAHLLEVDGGDISIADYNQGLRIGGSPGVTPSIPSAVVLSLWGCTSCLYVGYDAGGANTTGGDDAFIACASNYTNNTSKQKLRSIEPTRFINPVNN